MDHETEHDTPDRAQRALEHAALALVSALVEHCGGRAPFDIREQIATGNVEHCAALADLIAVAHAARVKRRRQPSALEELADWFSQAEIRRHELEIEDAS